MKTTTRIAKALCWLAFLPLAQIAHAAHPLVTDDTNVQGEGHHQIELNTDWMRQVEPNTHVGAFTYTYGATDTLDVIANLPLTFSSPSGINDASLGLKWRFAERGNTSFGLEPALLLPTGNQDKGLGTGRAGAALAFLVSHDAAPWTFHGNLGTTLYRYALPAQREDNQSWVWQASVAAAYQLTDKTLLVADTGVARNIERAQKTNPAYFLLGLIHSPQKNIDLDAGLKAGLNEAQIHRQFGVGLTMRF